ncbi:uncharacterized protein RSE6_02340 [Rhynchosporium secalis]|uniref:Hydrophobin n=1 Tax=Rhynchosporium secalis TaxID=38038 RepID=A0A1E1LZZ0_RHYSE|nr:uncharacterized protein RSE6_02340 [Rhynchosporium secalis]
MQLTKVFAIFSLAATSLAAPTVEMAEKRTDGPAKGLGCGTQNVGELKCCDQKAGTAPISTLGITPLLQSLLGIGLSTVPQIVSVIESNVQCIPIIQAGQACSNVQVCCIPKGVFSGPGAASAATQGGLITLLNGNNVLSNNQFAICPATVV